MWVIDFYGFACDVSAFAVFILSISIILCGGILGILKDGILLFYIDE